MAKTSTTQTPLTNYAGPLRINSGDLVVGITHEDVQTISSLAVAGKWRVELNGKAINLIADERGTLAAMEISGNAFQAMHIRSATAITTQTQTTEDHA